MARIKLKEFLSYRSPNIIINLSESEKNIGITELDQKIHIEKRFFISKKIPSNKKKSVDSVMRCGSRSPISI